MKTGLVSKTSPPFGSVYCSHYLTAMLGVMVLLAGAETLRPGISIWPNASFESPMVPETSPYAMARHE